MNVADLDVSQLTQEEKIALMERLWEGMPTDELQPPKWHDAILAERKTEWEKKDAVSRDWTEAKAAMRRDLL